MLEKLKKEVLEANLELVEKGLVIYTWGNVSGIDRSSGYVVIKPSGVSYDKMRAKDMVVVDLKGNVIEGDYRPSSDTPTHIALYNAFEEIGGVVHTHSEMAVVFAQAGIDIPAMGTTHADYFYGAVPCTRSLTREEVENDYELNTGKVIVETVQNRAELDLGFNAMSVPAVVAKNHGPFAWGKDADNAVYNAVVLEKVAAMAFKSLLINPYASPAPQYLLDKHYHRKHGKNAYYGQG